jgi:hypothetical protein
MARRVELEFSDKEMGCDELGWIPRELQPDDSENACENDDVRYQRMLKVKGIKAQVLDGYAFVQEETK